MQPRIQEVLGYLDSTRSELSNAVDAVSPERRSERPAPECWSVAEVLDHLNIIETRIIQLLNGQITAARTGDVGPETETSSVIDSIDRTRIRDRSQRVTAPEMVRPQSGRDATSAWEALQQSRAGLRAAVLAGDGLALGEIKYQHPALGLINMYQWIIFVGSHEARHTDQIREIASDFAGHSSATAEAN
jgi:uncharacterized damage-inducible protein DinB